MWTYSGDPSASTRDTVRFIIGDTDEDDQQLFDAEIDYLLDSAADNPYLAAVYAAQALLAKFTRLADRTVGDLSISYSQRVQQYAALVRSLKIDYGFKAVRPYAGGLRISDKAVDASDPDLVQPYFSVGMMDNNEA